MLRVGLTGNIGSGKTLVCRIFESTGIPVFHADEAGHAALEDAYIRQQLLERHGSAILQPDGSLNRRALASIVFNRPEELDLLSGLVHPFVRQTFEHWCTRQSDAPVVIHEAAILFESGFYRYFDCIVFIIAPEEVRIQRVMLRDRVTLSEVKARMSRQWPEVEKIALSHYVIHNDGKSPLIPQVTAVLEALKEHMPCSKGDK